MSDEAETSLKKSDISLPDPSKIAKPLHIQRLEYLLRLEPFLNYIESHQTFISEDDASDSDEDVSGPDLPTKDCKVVNGILTTRSERKADRVRVYNLSKVRKNRKWLKNVLLSESSSEEDDVDITEEKFHQMMKCHLFKKRYQGQYHNDIELQQYQYYGAGLLSNADKFAEHQRSFSTSRKKNRNKDRKSDKKSRGGKLKKKQIKRENLENLPSDVEKNGNPNHEMTNADDFSPPSSVMAGDEASRGQSPISTTVPVSSHRHHKKEKKPVTEATWNQRRRRLWVAISKKEISRAQKQKVSAHKEMLSSCKKMAQGCLKECRKEALLSQKAQKDTPSRCKRLSREMLLYWKKFEKVEKEHRKRAEKEAQEQLKMDVELREAKRQQRKLNFLITQTELYAHFMSRKITGEKDGHGDEILSQLDEDKNDCKFLSFQDDYDSELVKAEILGNVEDAYNQHMTKTRTFDVSPSENELNENFKLTEPSLSTEEEKPQPKMFVGKLKSYQLKGMNWLYQLYNNGINGILADEMGLGKTVQSISFLAHIAETQGIWGPFLVVAPASTLHNWQQEFTRFVPQMRVLPYWGNASDRKIIRKFWNEKGLHTEQASFHVLITSYQLVIQDVKYFQRIKWQYMILDEAQAIKSASSVRWKLLLGFNCRNRLLLTGTPIQNSMAELWALLHFIMPTMFDSHQEFNEWFSKDIESHAENRSVIDEKHLSRLHMILKPFMLRRIKKDVENELSDKIEILQYCALTSRQKHLYQGLKNKISIEDLFNSSSASVSASQAHLATSSLMNLVIQFRKVCNHPELFERREVISPFHMSMPDYLMSKFIYRNGFIEKTETSRNKLFMHTLGIFHPHHIHESLKDKSCDVFSFLHFVNMTPADLSNIMLCGLLSRLLAIYLNMKSAYRIAHDAAWGHSNNSRFQLMAMPRTVTSHPNIASSLILRNLVFTSYTSSVYTHISHFVHHKPKNVQHNQLRVKKLHQSGSTSLGSPNRITSPIENTCPLLNEKPVQVLTCCPTEVPSFLLQTTPKVVANPVECMCSDCDAVWQADRSRLCGSYDAMMSVFYGHPDTAHSHAIRNHLFFPAKVGGLTGSRPNQGWSRLVVLNKEMLVTDSGKLKVLDSLLKKLKAQDHRVLIYSQMTRMIDLLEEYMWHRKHTYIRLDGSSKISDRRDMVADFQSRSDIFVFLLSTRAGGLGINLTAADTVIFYDSDWNPTVDQQAMDRAHRLGQTKQVTVYRLICKGTIEERILQRAREKSEIQRMVISGGNFKPDTLKPKEVVSLLLDDDEMENKLWLRQEERRAEESGDRKRKRKDGGDAKSKRRKKKDADAENTIVAATVTPASNIDTDVSCIDSVPPSPFSEQRSPGSLVNNHDETSNEGSLVVDDGPNSFGLNLPNSSPSSTSSFGGTAVPASTSAVTHKVKGRGAGRRGRPKGSGKRGPGAGSGGSGVVSGGAMSAAEIAGAQAGRSAAYAAYGYQLSTTGGHTSPIQAGGSPSSVSSSSRNTSRGSMLRHRRGGLTRGTSHKKLLYDRLTNSGNVNDKNKNQAATPIPPVTPSMGFYTQND